MTTFDRDCRHTDLTRSKIEAKKEPIPLPYTVACAPAEIITVVSFSRLQPLSLQRSSLLLFIIRPAAVRCHDGLNRSPRRATLVLMIKTYILKPIMTFNTQITTCDPGKPGNGPTGTFVPAGSALKPRPAAVPPRQPLPAPVIDPTKPILQLGLMAAMWILVRVQR